MPLMDDLMSQAKNLWNKIGMGTKEEPPQAAEPKAAEEPKADEPST